jgi:hypothetical protein
MDLHISTILSMYSTTLEVACSPPEIGAEKSGEVLRTALEFLR